MEPSDTRPLMVTACSQTTDEDFKFLYGQKYKDEQTERVKILMERKRALEERLKACSDLLSEIHETSARRAQLLAHTSPLLKSTKPIPLQTVESQAVYKKPQLSPKKDSSNNPPTSLVMSTLHSLASTDTENVKYTIKAEVSGEDNGEPIEIQLAEEDGSLNSSADSGRLVICLTPEQNVDIKTEAVDVDSHCNTASSAGQNVIKRRKLEKYENNAFKGDSDFNSINDSLSKINKYWTPWL